MNDLIIPTDFEKVFPSSLLGFRKAIHIFNSIKSFEDIERVFLKGAGLSINTYKSYLESIKQLYEYTDHKNPMQITAGDIEGFYDSLIEKGISKNTGRLRVSGLKKFFVGVEKVVPFYVSPFTGMSKKLIKKLARTKKGGTKKALTKVETIGLLNYLKKNITNIGLSNYALVYMLATSGLRVDELCQLQWKDVEEVDGYFTTYYIQKGGDSAETELYGPALEAVTRSFRRSFDRNPQPQDYLFYSEPRYPSDDRRKMSTHTLWSRIKNIGIDAEKEGIIKRNLTFSPHLFRRTLATLLYREGMKIKGIQLKLRHKNIQTTAEHYIDDSEKTEPYLKAIFVV